MENYSVIIVIMAIMIGLSALADKIKIPYPVLLIAAGIGLGFIPSLPRTEINPEVIFLIFLPPLLYDAAFNLSFPTFKTNISTISTLAISLVFMTAIGVAVAAYYLIPGMTWPLAFVLGSILSATDAVAAMSITKGLGLSHSTNTILEGESLVNDASALVAYRFAVAAVTGSSFVFWKASLEFVILMAGGFLVGVIMARLLGFFLSRLHHNFMVTIGLMLLMPFVTYLVAEEVHVSGVIAVVMLGLMISRFSKTIFPEDLKMQSKAIWDIIIFLLNGLIFILIGLQFPYLLKSIHPEDILRFTLYAFIITLVALLLRIIYVFLQRRNLLKSFRGQRRRITKDALLDFKSSIIISWSGMRGIVSLAIALGLPQELADGSKFPFRDPLIFISVAVVIFTLVGQGLTLPWIVKKLQQTR
ncbi:Na+/H+ antiporter [Sphingobacteriaceae bacterium]|nr:Na+/H+ antiporter [Sphingobacteriaceae bacterium]